MSRISDTNPAIYLKRDHQTSSFNENISSLSTKKIKSKHNNNNNLMDKDKRSRYSNGSSSGFFSSHNSSIATKKLVIKNIKSKFKRKKSFIFLS